MNNTYQGFVLVREEGKRKLIHLTYTSDKKQEFDLASRNLDAVGKKVEWSRWLDSPVDLKTIEKAAAVTAYVLNKSDLPYNIYISGENLESRVDEIHSKINNTGRCYDRLTGLNSVISQLDLKAWPQLYVAPLGLAELVCDALAELNGISAEVWNFQNYLVYSKPRQLPPLIVTKFGIHMVLN